MARVDTLPQVPFPLPDPEVVLQHVWVTQGGRDWSISPTRLGFIQQSRIAPVNPYFYQLWWDTSALPSGQAVLRAYVNNLWVEIGPFGDQFGNVTVPGNLTVTGGKISGANADGFLEIASNLLIDGGKIGGPKSGALSTTGDFTVGGNLTANGTTTLKGATTITGGLRTDTLTASGAVTFNGSLSTNTLTITGSGTGTSGSAGFTATNGQFSGFLTVGGTLTANGGITYTGGATGDTLTLTGTAPQITLNNGSTNWIRYGTGGVNPPTLTTSSPGTKLLLSPSASPTSYDTAIGLQFNAMWFSAGGYAFYGIAGLPATMAVDTAGNLVISSANWNIVGGAGSTTLNIQFVNAAQRIEGATLASTGDAAIGGNLGVSGALGVNGTGSLFNNGLTVNAPSGQIDAIITNGGLGINGASTFNGSMVINPSQGAQDSLVCTGALECRATVTGGTAFACRGNAEFDNNVFVGGALSISNLSISGTLTAGDIGTPAAQVSGLLQVGGGLFLAGVVPGEGVTLVVNGNAAVAGFMTVGGVAVTSDASVKSDVAGFSRGLDAVRRLRPVSYRMTGIQGRQHGLIADEVEEVIPEAVSMSRDLKAIDPMVLIATLINTVRELGEKVEGMRDELDRISSRPRE